MPSCVLLLTSKLEELIAPDVVEFYDADWNEIGSKSNRCEEIALITQIDRAILKGEDDPRKRSVAERMSWPASRTTSRLEDVAYCLMGLFDVNIPMLYGEGTRAFIRLQEEIIRRTEDYTIFAWTADPLNNTLVDYSHPSQRTSSFLVAPLTVQKASRHLITSMLAPDISQLAMSGVNRPR